MGYRTERKEQERRKRTERLSGNERVKMMLLKFKEAFLLFCTLKSDKEAMSSSSSLVAQEADILACC